MFCALQVLTNGVEFLKCNIDRAVLSARQEESALAVFQILLNRRPPRRSNSQSRSGDVRGDFVLLERMKLLELLKPESEHVVIESLGRATK